MIAGYTIVRKPLFEELFFGGGIMEPINGIYYHGINRSPWMDVADYFQTNPNDTRGQKYKVIKASGNDFTFIEVTKDYQEANELLNLNSEIALKNEIIALSSPLLSAKKGEVNSFTNSIEWLGYDIVHAGFSLLRHGVFENKQFILLATGSKLNQHGLFNDTNNISDFLDEYVNLSNKDMVEPIPFDARLKIDYIRIGVLSKQWLPFESRTKNFSATKSVTANNQSNS